MKKQSLLGITLALVLASIISGSGILLVRAKPSMVTFADFLNAYPCSTYRIKESPPEVVECIGYQGAEAAIYIPVPYIARVYPSYPVVGLPVVLATGWHPGSFDQVSAPKRDIGTDDVRVIGYQVEMMVRAAQFDKSGHNRLYKSKGQGKRLAVGHKETFSRPCSFTSLIKVSKKFGGINKEICETDHSTKTGYKGPESIYYEMGQGGADWFWGLSQVTPYHYGTTSWNGEPAFALEIASKWHIFGRSRWDKLEVWEVVDVEEKCTWVINPVTGIIEKVCEDVDIYGWADYGSGEGPWRPLAQRINTWTVAPDRATFVQEYPLLIYQSQPLLQAP